MDLFLIIFFILVINWFMGIIISIYINTQFFIYLKKHNKKRFFSMTILPPLGIFGITPFKSLPYIFNDQDTIDKNILEYKQRIRYWVIYSIIFFLVIALWITLAPTIELYIPLH